MSEAEAEIQKKEYLFLNRNVVGVIDPEKLYQLAKRKKLEADLERFMVKDTKEDLKKWILRNQISTKEIEGCMKYIMNAAIFRWNVERNRLWHV